MSSPTPDTETTLSIPSLLFVAAISFFAIRYFWSSRPSSSEAAAARQQINPAHLEHISQMFPELDRRSIMWDLRRNGGNMTATVERVMQGRGLERPPPSFQPVLASPTNPTNTTSSSPSNSSSLPTPSAPSLITRYNLQSRVATSDKGKAPVRDHDADSSILSSRAGETGDGMGWAKTKEERAEILKGRRDEMILRARRMMLERNLDPEPDPELEAGAGVGEG